MKKIKIFLLSIIGGLGVVAKTCLPEHKAIINAERSAVISAERSAVISAERNAGISAERSAGISAERSAAKNIEKEIKPTKDLESKLEKIIDIIDIIPLDDLKEKFDENNFKKITYKEVLKNENMPILRKILQKSLDSNINFTNTEIKDIITEESRSKYRLSKRTLSKIKLYFSKTYADYYYSILLKINSCNKNLITILTEYRKERGFEESGHLNKELRKCEGQAN